MRLFGDMRRKLGSILRNQAMMANQTELVNKGLVCIELGQAHQLS